MCLIFSQYSFAGEWYKGGTLHGSTIDTWYRAPYQDRLATCSDWVVALVDKADYGILFMDNMKVLRSLSESLEKCITDGNMVNGKILAPAVKTAERGALCWEIMQGLD